MGDIVGVKCVHVCGFYMMDGGGVVLIFFVCVFSY